MMFVHNAKRWVCLIVTISILLGTVTPAIAISDLDFKTVTEAHRVAYQTQPLIENLPKGVVGLDEQQMADLSKGRVPVEPTYMRFRDVLRWKRERALHEDMNSFGKTTPTFLVVDGQTLLKYNRSLTKFFACNPAVTLLLNVAKGDGFVGAGGTLNASKNHLPATLKHLWISNRDSDVVEIGKDFIQYSQMHTLRMSNFESLTTIRDGFFSGCSALIAVVMPPMTNLTKIGSRFFNYCCALEKFSMSPMPELKTIGFLFFAICHALERFVMLPLPNLTTIENWFFYGCNGLERFVMPALPNLTTIGAWFCSECNGLVSVVIGALPKLTTIEAGFFFRCKSLEGFVMPPMPNLQAIGGASFQDCQALRRFAVPPLPNLRTIGGGAFYDCSALEEVEFTETPSQQLAEHIYTMLKDTHRFARALTLYALYLSPELVRESAALGQRIHSRLDSKPCNITEGDPLTPDEILNEIGRFYYAISEKLSESEKHLFHKASQVIARTFNRKGGQVCKGPLTLNQHTKNTVLHNATALLQSLEDEPVACIVGSQIAPPTKTFSNEEKARILPFMKAFIQAFVSDDPDHTFMILNAIFQQKGGAEKVLWPLLHDFRFNALTEWERAHAPIFLEPSNVIRLALGFKPLRPITSLPATDELDAHLVGFFETYYTLDKMVAHVHGVLTSDASPLTPAKVRGILAEKQVVESVVPVPVHALSAPSSADDSSETAPLTQEEVKRVLVRR